MRNCMLAVLHEKAKKGVKRNAQYCRNTVIKKRG